MALKTKDLRLNLEVQPEIKTKIEPGQDVLASMAKCLEHLTTDIETIQEMDVPSDALEEARQGNTEVRKVWISGHYEPYLTRGYNYIVSYQTIRSRELGKCQTYNSSGLENIREKREFEEN